MDSHNRDCCLAATPFCCCCRGSLKYIYVGVGSELLLGASAKDVLHEEMEDPKKSWGAENLGIVASEVIMTVVVVNFKSSAPDK